MGYFIPVLPATTPVVTSKAAAWAARLVCGLALLFLAVRRRNSVHHRTEGNAPICCICGNRVTWEVYSHCKSNFVRFGGSVQASELFDARSKEDSAFYRCLFAT